MDPPLWFKTSFNAPSKLFFDRLDMDGVNSTARLGKALIIEDDKEMRSMLEDFLKEEGFETDSVEKGNFALKKLMTESFGFIVTDIRMPGLSGLDILPELRKLQPKTPIIVITAFGSEEIHRKALRRGADAYLEKPVHLLKLRTLIHNLVNSKVK